MRNKYLTTVLVVAAAITAAAFEVPTQALRSTAPVSQDLVVSNLNNTAGVTLNKNTTNYLITARNAGTTKFTVDTNGTINSASLTASLPVFSDASKNITTKTVSDAKIALGIVVTNVAMGASFTKSNSWNGSFSSTPFVALGGPSNQLAHVVGKNSTGIIVGVFTTNTTVDIIAIGAP